MVEQSFESEGIPSPESARRLSLALDSMRPVFVFGSARGGTSMFYRLLLQHPSFQIRRDPRRRRHFETHAFARPHQLLELHNGPFEDLATYMANDEDWLAAMRKLMAELKPRHQRLSVLARTLRPWMHRRPVRQLHWRLLQYHHAARIYFHFARLHRGSERLLEKTPHHCEHVPEILATFPLARMIFVARHPLDVYSSYRKRLRQELESLTNNHAMWGWLAASPREFQSRYRRQVLQAIDDAKVRPKQYLMLRYEDVVADPAAVLQRTCEFLDEPYDPAYFFHDSGESSKIVLMRRTKDWAPYLREDEAASIESYLAPVMELLQYSRYSASKDDS